MWRKVNDNPFSNQIFWKKVCIDCLLAIEPGIIKRGPTLGESIELDSKMYGSIFGDFRYKIIALFQGGPRHQLWGPHKKGFNPKLPMHKAIKEDYNSIYNWQTLLGW